MRLHIDCDPGCDDAVAIWLALASPGIDVAAITTVAGNVSACQGAGNARRVLDFAGRDVPVLAGPERAANDAGVPAATVHGADGLAGLDLAAPSRPADAGDAVACLLGARHVAAIGPLSNLAAALARDPAWRPQTLAWMGGAAGPGNVTESAEYNAHCDPWAARAVLEAGLDPVIVPWDVALQARASDARLAALHGRVGAAAARMLRAWRAGDQAGSGADGGPLADPLAIAVLAAPSLFVLQPRSVRVAADGTTHFGPAGSGPPARLAIAVEAGEFFALLAHRLGAL